MNIKAVDSKMSEEEHFEQLLKDDRRVEPRDWMPDNYLSLIHI